MKYVNLLIITVLLFSFSESLLAREQWLAQIPNGQVNSCLNCHFSAGGGGSRNPFGKSVEDALIGNNVRWDLIFNIDSDGDGFTNGEELQDPDGQWNVGDSGPGNTTLVTLPGDASSKPTVSSVENDFVERNSNIYPQPTKGIVSLDYLSNYFEMSELNIYNLNGVILHNESTESKIGENNLTIDMNQLSLHNGTYFIVLRNRYFNIKKRIVLSK